MSLAVLAILATSLAAQQVHVVDDDGGPGVDFTSLAAAVQAAASGDVILIESGTYSQALAIDGKGLTLVADEDATVVVQGGQATVANLPAGQSVTLRGLHSFLMNWNLAANAGTVWFEDCFLEFGDSVGPGTINAVDCANVVITRCEVLGLPAIAVFGDDVPSDGINALRSQVTLHESAVTGGSGDLSMTTVDVPGEEAVELVDSTLFLGGSTLTGGPGATAAGGAGLLSSSSHVWLLDELLAGGTGTPPGAPTATDGQGSLTTLAGAHFAFEIESPKRMGQTIAFTLEGPPGSQAWLLKSLSPGGFIKPGWGGVLLVDPSSFALTALGSIPASGSLAFSGTLPVIAGFDAVPLVVQGLSVGPGGVTLASGSELLLLAADL